MRSKIIFVVVFITAILLVSVANAHDEECEIVVRRDGVYNGLCPRGTVVVGSRTDHIGNFTYTYVACSKVELLCGKELEEYRIGVVIQQDFIGFK